MVLPFGVYRADQVGSLLRSREVLDAREQVAEGKLSDSELRAIEDKHIAPLVQKQIDAGLRSITDGEFRRAYFHLDFLKHLSGVEISGDIKSNKNRFNMGPPRPIVTGTLSHPSPIQVSDFQFLEHSIQSSGAKNVTTKVCIPSPTMLHFRGGRDSIDKTAYPTLTPFFTDLARVYQEELAALYAAGCRMVQLDDTNLAYLCDPNMRAEAEKRDEDLTTLPKRYAELINAAISKRPKDMTIGIHLCRGNYRSQWFAQGGYAPVAEVLFKHLDVDAYFLEYDDARSGDFSPLKYLPENKVVVLGVMTSKTAAVEDKEGIKKRVLEAAEYCGKGLEQLCLSHQCGFSSTAEGNELGEEEQWAKIRSMVEIAKGIWGEDLSK